MISPYCGSPRCCMKQTLLAWATRDCVVKSKYSPHMSEPLLGFSNKDVEDTSPHFTFWLLIWSSWALSVILTWQQALNPPSSRLLFCSAFTVWTEHQHIQKHSILSVQRTAKSVLMLPACHLMPQWGTVWIYFLALLKKTKKQKNACSTDHSRSSVDG